MRAKKLFRFVNEVKRFLSTPYFFIMSKTITISNDCHAQIQY